jgi:hypothetical protein
MNVYVDQSRDLHAISKKIEPLWLYFRSLKNAHWSFSSGALSM